MKSILISEKVWDGNTNTFNRKLNEALEKIEVEEGYVREKIYSCKSCPDSTTHLWHSVLIFYEIIPTRKTITEKTEK